MLNVYEKITILQYFEKDLDALLEFIENLTPENVLAAKNFIEDVILEKLSERKETFTTRGELHKSWEPIQKYFDARQCGEDLDDCEKDTCYRKFPKCFFTKVSGQIKSMDKFFHDRLNTVPAVENK